MAIQNFMDILPGAIVTSAQGKQYVVLADDAGNRGLFSEKGTWIRPNDGELTFGKNRMKVQKVEVFDTLPVLDQISEGIKYIYTDRECAPLTTVYTAEDPRVVEAKAKMIALQAEMVRQQAIIYRYQ